MSHVGFFLQELEDEFHTSGKMNMLYLDFVISYVFEFRSNELQRSKIPFTLHEPG